jgi:hypothetical protein
MDRVIEDRIRRTAVRKRAILMSKLLEKKLARTNVDKLVSTIVTFPVSRVLLSNNRILENSFFSQWERITELRRGSVRQPDRALGSTGRSNNRRAIPRLLERRQRQIGMDKGKWFHIQRH